MAILIAIGVYLAFTKQIPFTSQGYELHATFENAATLRPTSPVRIAGVNVGEVTSVERRGRRRGVTFTVDDEGQPIHEDATSRSGRGSSSRATSSSTCTRAARALRSSTSGDTIPSPRPRRRSSSTRS